MPESQSGVRYFSAATLMSTADDRLQLARAVLRAAETLGAT